MKNFLLTYIAIFTYFSLFAQEAKEVRVHINWEETKTFTFENESEKRLSFEGANYIEHLPYYTYTTPLANQEEYARITPELVDLAYIACTPEEEALLQNTTIGTGIKMEAYMGMEQKLPSFHLHFLPIVKIEGKLMKISAATLRMSQALTSAKRKTTTRSSTQTYADNSILTHGDWIKISVSISGIHRISYEELISMGIDNPAQVSIFGYGGAQIEENFATSFPREDDLPQLAIFQEKGSDGNFGPGDYVLFWAQGPNKVAYDTETGMWTQSPNTYSNAGYYFLSSNVSEPKYIQTQAEIDAPVTMEIDYFLDIKHHEIESVNLLSSGREWYGEEFNSAQAYRAYNFKFPNICPDKERHLLLETIAYSTSVSSSFLVEINNTEEQFSITIPRVTSSFYAANTGNISKYLDPSSNENVGITLNYQAYETSEAHLNQITINAFRQLIMEEDQMDFSLPASTYLGFNCARYHIQANNSSTQIWEITVPNHVEHIDATYESGEFNFLSLYDKERRFCAVNTSAEFPSPRFVSTVNNQNLHALNGIDLLIISPEEYISEANRIADLHRVLDHQEVAIVTPEQVYNEFSSGTPDATAYRLIMKMLYDRSEDNTELMPKSLLFFGISSFDNRGIEFEQVPLLSYQSVNSLNRTSSYTTDDYYGLLDDTEGGNLASDKMDIGVGRLPISSLNEAKTAADKIIEYAANNNKGSWKTKFTFLADDGDNNIHMNQANQLTEQLASISGNYQAEKIFLDAFQMEQSASGGYYPVARKQVLESLQSGTFIFNYTGHGSPNSLTSEQTISRSDILNMYNEKMALWITATCDFSRYDDDERSAGMDVLLNPDGGGIALLSTTRVVFSNDNFLLNKAVFNNLIPSIGDAPLCLGEIIRKSKVDLGYNQNKLNFSLLGDPALCLNYARLQMVTDSINGEVPGTEKMSALGLITVKGHVDNEDGSEIESNFNGTATITVYDKEETMTTLSNKGNTPFQYTDRPNIIFSGTIEVIDGKFDFTFMVPKDINYMDGTGRILYYAKDEANNWEAAGYNEDFLVGGTDPDAEHSDTAPNARIYLNSTSFENGQTVNDQAVFFAFLNDEYGINTVGAGIGHDITIRINDNGNTSYVLNDYYEANLGDYTSGSIQYQLPSLDPGSYTLEFKAWNLQNVSTTQTLDFVVGEQVDPHIDLFYAAPNPADTYTTFVLEYDRPMVTVEVSFIVYDLAGRTYWKSEEETLTNGRIEKTWDLSGSSAAQVRPGVYLVKAIVETEEGVFTSKSQKIIVAPQ